MAHHVLSKLREENRLLTDKLSRLDAAQGRECSLAHLENELQRARSKHDQAIQRRQQQVAELEQLTSQCQSMMQAAGARQKQSPAQRTVAQLESQLAAVARRLQCAVSMQYYLDQAEQQHKQEQHDAELQVQALNEALSRAQAKLQEAKAKQIVSKTSKAAAKQALAAAEQQLAAGRARRANLMQQLAVQCQSDVAAADAGGGCSLDQAMQLCATMPSVSCGSSAQQWMQAAAEACAAAGCSPQASLGSDEDAVSCLSRLLAQFGCSSIPDLLQTVDASLQGLASLGVALQATLSITVDAAETLD